MNTNPLLLQKQLRENAANLEDFTKELKSWGEEMKRKENSITGKKEVPLKRKLRKPASNNTVPEKTKTSITKLGGTDYVAWDKFDVDAELEKLEDDINDDSELTDECNQNIHDEAILEKLKGNKFVKIQKWDDAINCYSKAIKCYSYDPIFYANRALCFLKTGRYQEAEKDCNLSLKLDQTYVKALQRRAAARIEMQKFEYAEDDLLKVLQYEPKNIESKRELEKLRAKMKVKVIEPLQQRPVSKFTASRNKSKISSAENHKPPFTSPYVIPKKENLEPELETHKIDNSKPISTWPILENIISVKPINKQPHLRSQQPLIRIKIKDIGGKVTDTSTNKESNKQKQNQKNEEITSWPSPTGQLYSINSDDLKIIEKKNPKDKKNTSNNNLISKLHEKNSSPVRGTHISVQTEELSKISEHWEVPKTSVQFYSHWNNFKSSEEKYKYLKSIDPEELPKIFLNSLESGVFSKILEVLAENCTEIKDPVARILDHLANVKRFSTFVMFMTDLDKKNLWKLFDHIKEIKELGNMEVDKLMQKYEL